MKNASAIRCSPGGKKSDAGPIRLSASFQVATVRSLGDKPRHELNAEPKCGLESSNSN